MSLLEVDGLVVEYGGRRAARAVDGVSFAIERGETLGLVGESGCGKSSVARAVSGLVRPAAGSVVLDGRPVRAVGSRRRPVDETGVQMVFQDPGSSLNPRRRVGTQVADGLATARARSITSSLTVEELLAQVELPASSTARYPHQLSGGQKQRVAAARALAARPALLVADEPISALDASTQSRVAALMRRLCQEVEAGMLFISHDLSVVRLVADRLVVMHRGRVVESGPTDEVWAEPGHAYTRALLRAIPVPDGTGRLPDAPDDQAYFSGPAVLR